MKKKHIFITAIGTLFLSAGVFSAVHFSAENANSSDLTLSNIEAMALGKDLEDGYEFVNKHGVDLGGGAVQVTCTCGGDGFLSCC
ncbi:hypothetical protein [uncultured Rikenella sp.]|uniref:hypothetical protein n=1 Tax=uncultured Rikenella sp. TaxID=368003 RepID=UPI00261EB441|nr:hypothetical protein [uncultured Rikenella sp.]